MLRLITVCFTSACLVACVPGVLSKESPSSVEAEGEVTPPGSDGQGPPTTPKVSTDAGPQVPPESDAGGGTPPDDPPPDDPPPAKADAAIIPTPDQGPPPLPATCEDGDAVDLADARREKRSDIFIVERHFVDGSAIESEVTGTFDDYSLYTAAAAATESFGVNCVGIAGKEFLVGDKHCEYTTTSCDNDAECGEGVSCRETDRLDAASISIRGLKVGALDVERLGVGRFESKGLTEVFGSEDVSITIGKGDAHSHYAYDYYWYFSGELAPKKVRISAPDLAGGVAVGKEDLIFQWAPGTYYPQYESDLIYIELRAAPSADARRVRCVVKDDGCKTIPAAALQWVTSSMASGSQLHAVVSHRFPLAQKDYDTDDTDWRLISIREVHGSLKVQ